MSAARSVSALVPFLLSHCYDNAVMESFFHMLKTEFVNHEKFATKQQAKDAIFEWIEDFCNRECLRRLPTLLRSCQSKSMALLTNLLKFHFLLRDNRCL